jgi:hypothetical protein
MESRICMSLPSKPIETCSKAVGRTPAAGPPADLSAMCKASASAGSPKRLRRSLTI